METSTTYSTGLGNDPADYDWLCVLSNSMGDRTIQEGRGATVDTKKYTSDV